MSVVVIGFTTPQREGVTLESNCPGPAFGPAIEELQDMEPRLMATRYASQHGVLAPSVTLARHPYPVDASGKVINKATDDEGKIIPIHRYRVDVPIVSNDL